MQLSKRERILVGVLVCMMAAAALYVFLISPALQTRSDQKMLNETLTDQKILADETIARAETSKKEIVQLEQEAKELFQMMSKTKSYNVSLILSDMLGRHGLTPVSLEFSDYETAQPPANMAESQSEARAENDEADLEEEDGLDAEAEEPAMTYALKRTAVLRFQGGQSSVGAFIDEITDYNLSYIVSGYTLSQSNSERLDEIRLDLYEFVEPESWDAAVKEPGEPKEAEPEGQGEIEGQGEQE